MQIQASPGFRFGWQGTTVDYVVRVHGASELALPKQDLEGAQAQLTDVHRTADGVEGRIQVAMHDASFV